ncbi:MAG: hypothetical protein WC301_04955 [Candidatus Omnitrophota bacterium]|jgi:type II secretory pathway component PulK
MIKENAGRGSILIIVIWTLFMLTSFALVLSEVIRQKIALVSRIQDRNKLHYICDAGAKKAIAALKNREQKNFYSFGDSICDNPAIFSNIRAGDGFASVSYEYFDEISASRVTKYGLIDEERKININRADENTLERLFRILLRMDEKDAQELAYAVVDWRDSDNITNNLIGGAEDSYYTGLPRPYEAKDADLQVPEEIILIRGMNKEIYEKIKDYVTIYGEGRVNVNTASRVALLAVGLSQEMADKVITFRCGEDGIPGTSDDNVFETVSGIAPLLSRSFDLSPSQLAQISEVAADRLGVASGNFTIISRGSINNRKVTQAATCVVNKDAQILYWRES